MSKYKVGDKVVMEILRTDDDGYYEFGNDNLSWWWFGTYINEISEPLSTYTEPLEAKIRRQAAEITRLLAENKRLKAENGNSLWNIEQARAEGTEAAWELARKIFDMETSDIEDIFITEDAWNLGTVLNNYTYTEAATRVAEWEKVKEIKVGDVVSREGLYGVVKSVSDGWLNGITASGISFQWLKRKCTKTGRHIDIDSFLKQIGEE